MWAAQHEKKRADLTGEQPFNHERLVRRECSPGASILDITFTEDQQKRTRVSADSASSSFRRVLSLSL